MQFFSTKENVEWRFLKSIYKQNQGSKCTRANRNDVQIREIMTKLVPVPEIITNIVQVRENVANIVSIRGII